MKMSDRRRGTESITPRDIVLEGVCKSFGGQTVLKDLSLRFPGGEVSCVMAPSGAGKTTLLRILMGLERPDAGRITGLEGAVTGAVFQEDRLLPWATASGNLRFACGRLSGPEIRRALAELGLAGSEARPARELSGGMARRVALLRALMAENDVLLLDEPFKGLDEETRRLAMDALLRRRAGRTAVMVTHDRTEAEALGARIFTLPARPREADP